MSMSNPEITDSPQVQIMRSFCEAFEKRDLALVAKHLHKDHRRITHPQSVGVPVQSKEEYLQHLGEVMSLWIDCQASYTSSNILPQAKSSPQPTIHSIIEAPGGKVVTHVCTPGVQINNPSADVVPDP